MITSLKRKSFLSVLCTMLILFSVVCSSATVAYAKDSSFDMSGKVYELDKDSHYDYSSASSSAAQAGKNTFGKFSVSGNARANGIQDGFASYGVNSGNLSFSYSFDKKLLEKDEYEWCIYEDSGKEIAGIELDEKIKNGAIIIQASFHSLAHGTVAVLAGIVVDVLPVAAFTLAYVCSHLNRSAFHNALRYQ